jgi:hypothetical protein
MAGGVAMGYDWWNTSQKRSLMGQPTMLMRLPGIETPACDPPGKVRLPDNTEVIGVSAAGKYRAYTIQSLFFPNHIVNDLLGKVPVTVTYCDLTDTVKVFTDKRRGKPLPLKLGGWLRYESGSECPGVGMACSPKKQWPLTGKLKGTGSMLLYVQGKRYIQESCAPVGSRGTAKSFPYAEFAFSRTTWKKWKTVHPDTDIYTGMRRSFAPHFSPLLSR